MILTTNQLREIVAAGGSLILDASLTTRTQLEQLAAAAAASGTATITVKNVGGVPAPQLVALAALAPGRIVIDLTPQETASAGLRAPAIPSPRPV